MKMCATIPEHEWISIPPTPSQPYRYHCAKCGIGSYIGPSYLLLDKYKPNAISGNTVTASYILPQVVNHYEYHTLCR
jgi:hypothetical protein